MTINVKRGDSIRGHIQPNANQHREAQHAINKLEYPDIWRGAGTLHTEGDTRVDKQKVNKDGSHNIQVQLGNGTLAHVNVSPHLQTDDPANQRGVANKVRSGLQQSLDSGHSHHVDGDWKH